MGVFEPVEIPGGKPLLFYKGERHDNSPKMPDYRFIKVLITGHDLLRLDIHPSVVDKIIGQQVIHSKMFKGIAIPFAGAALPPGTFKVVI